MFLPFVEVVVLRPLRAYNILHCQLAWQVDSGRLYETTAATHEDVAHDREIAADTVEDAISLTRRFSYHQKTYLESGEVTHTDAMLDKIVEFVGRKPDGATVREVQQRIRKTAKITSMYLDKLVPGRLTRVEVPPAKYKGGHTKVIYRLPEQ